MKDRHEGCVDARCRSNRLTNLITLIWRKKPQPQSVVPTHSGAQPFRVRSKGLSGEFMLHQNTGCAEVRSAYADDFITLLQRLPLSEMSADEAGVGGAERASQSSV